MVPRNRRNSDQPLWHTPSHHGPCLPFFFRKNTSAVFFPHPLRSKSCTSIRFYFSLLAALTHRHNAAGVFASQPPTPPVEWDTKYLKDMERRKKNVLLYIL